MCLSIAKYLQCTRNENKSSVEPLKSCLSHKFERFIHYFKCLSELSLFWSRFWLEIHTNSLQSRKFYAVYLVFPCLTLNRGKNTVKTLKTCLCVTFKRKNV